MFYNSRNLVSVGRGCSSSNVLPRLENLRRGFVNQARAYSQQPEDTCCKPISQTEGRKVEKYPKHPPGVTTPGWRCECPTCVPPSYDPYKIKMPEVVVPPIPESNAKQWPPARKDTAVLTTPTGDYRDPRSQQQYPFNYPRKLHSEEEESEEAKKRAEEEKESKSLIGLIKGFFVMFSINITESLDLSFVGQPRKKDKSPESEFDLPKCVPYVLVGAGPAAWSAFEEIKNQDPKYRVLFITDEDAMPYKRMPMSRHMWWMDNTPDYAKLMYTEDEEFKSMYQTKCKDFMDIFKFSKRKRGPALALAMGWEVVEVDPDYHMVWVKTICGERPIYYERCLLATGALPRTLTVLRQSSKEVRKLVTTFRTLRDLELAFRRVREAKHITIIGGGLLGTELAWFLGRMYKMLLHQQQDKDSEPLKITLLSKDQGLMSSILPSYLSEWCVERLKDCNITILPKVQAYDFCKSDDGKLQITLSNGTNLVTDFAFLCIGAKARTDIARRSNLETDPINGGYVCNSEMQIRRHLFTAGDVASTYIQWKDTRMRFEHLENAIMTGRIAGGNMTGLWEPCELEPQYELRLGKTIDFQVVGEVGGCMPTIGLFKPCEGKDTSNIDHLTEEEQAMPCNIKKDEYMNRFKHGIVFFLRGEYIVGIMFWNMPKKIDDRAAVASEMLRARPTHEDVNLLAEQLGFFDQECSVGKFEEKLDIPCPMVDKSRMKFPDVD